MSRRRGENMGELLVLAGSAIHKLQIELAEFLGVSDRTMRRWTVGGTRLIPSKLTLLVEAVHPNDPVLAGRIAAYHGQTLEEMGLGLPPEQRVAFAIVRAAADVVGVSPSAMRPAIAAALERAKAEGLTLESAHALVAAPSKGTKKSG
jgi:hypothetical protein